MEEAYKVLFSTINSKVKLTETDVNLIKSRFEYVEFEAGIQLIRPGEVAKKVYFISSGSMRLYHDLPEEKTLFIFLEGLFAGAYDSFLNQTPCEGYVETIEPVKGFAVDIEDMHSLDENLPAWNTLQRKVAEERYLQAKRRLKAFLKFDPQERYREIAQFRPELIERIPPHILASFMGISKEEYLEISAA
ncbi:MAG: Crp/Fnr family transcriptional regulator [Schleiferiaceae bacterium]